MRAIKKKDFPVAKIRRLMEPGPIVLVSSAWKGRTNIMTMGWHMVLEFEPALIGCYIWDANHSYEMIRRSGECVINIPTLDLADAVVGIGNSSGEDIDKFETFGLTAARARKVKAPLIAECYANLECKIADTRLLRRYGVFVFEVVKAHSAAAPKYPKTLHYHGDGVFMVAGPRIDMRGKFKPQNL
jgi:flavin reductase (DIM6/NTAB) family NADH-FMN oxidoreductase RutF